MFPRGSLPTLVKIYPRVIRFGPDDYQKHSKVWISVGKESEGTKGSIIFAITGPNSDIFRLENPLREYIVVRPERIVPVIQDLEHIEGDGYIELAISTNEPVTIYWFLQGPQGGIKPTFDDIKSKKLKYDYFGGNYFVGEEISHSATNNFIVNLTNLPIKAYFDLFIFAEDLSGNMA